LAKNAVQEFLLWEELRTKNIDIELDQYVFMFRLMLTSTCPSIELDLSPVCIYVQADADLNLSRADVEKHRMNRHGDEKTQLIFVVNI
jgi:hypothetical protein